MSRAPLVLAASLAIAGAFLVACSDDDGNNVNRGDAGTGGAIASGGASSSGGAPVTGGKSSTGGAHATGGVNATGGAHATGGTKAEVVADAGTGGSSSTGGVSNGTGGAIAPDLDGGTDGSSAPDASTPGARLVLAGVTDYTWSSFASVELATGTVLQRWSTEGSAVLVGRNGVGFVVEHNNAVVDTLDSEGLFRRRIDLRARLGDGGTPDQFLNPHDVVPVPGTHKAYVSLNGANTIEVVDVEEGTVTGLIDVSAFVPPGQPRVSADMGVYDPKTKRVYFELQRLDVLNYGCATWPALLIGIDPTNDQIVDINGAAEGLAIPLTLQQPVSVALRGNELYVLATGCNSPDAGFQYVGQGIEVVDLTAGTSAPSFRTAEQNFGLGIELLDAKTAVVSRNSLDYLSVVWNTWALGSSSLGAPLTNAPPVGGAVENSDTLIGVATLTTDGGTSTDLVRYSLSNGQSSVFVENPWGLDPSTSSSPAGVVLLR